MPWLLGGLSGFGDGPWHGFLALWWAMPWLLGGLSGVGDGPWHGSLAFRWSWAMPWLLGGLSGVAVLSLILNPRLRVGLYVAGGPCHGSLVTWYIVEGVHDMSPLGSCLGGDGP